MDWGEIEKGVLTGKLKSIRGMTLLWLSNYNLSIRTQMFFHSNIFFSQPILVLLVSEFRFIANLLGQKN